MPSSLTTFHSITVRLLASPTCVGLRYGRPSHSPLELFSPADSRRLGAGRSPPSPSGLGGPVRPPTPLDGRSTWPLVLRSSVPRVGTHATRAGPESSPARRRLRLWGLALGPASPCADRHGAGTLGLPVSKVFTWIRAYSFRHPHFPPLHRGVTPGLPRDGNAPLPLKLPLTARACALGRAAPRPRFGGPLNPDHSRRVHAGLVSCYALFQGWLLLSQPPSCHGTDTSFAILSGHSGALAVAPGSFPLARGHYRPQTASQGICYP